MSELREFYNERKNEVEQFCIFLNKIEDDITYSSNMSILKSQAIIIIYNLIEGSVNKGIEYIFDSIADSSLKNHELSEDIRVMWLRYFKLHLDDNGQNKQSLENLDKFVNNVVEINLTSFRENNKSYFSSGNLNSDAIKKILKKFSIKSPFPEYQLQIVKTDRNFLAHGEKSFTEVSQTKSTSDIDNMKNKTIDYLDKYILRIEDYVNNEKYKKSTQTIDY